MNILHSMQSDVDATAWKGDNGRVFLDIGTSTVTMTPREARVLAASLMDAAIRAEPFIPLRGILTGNADLVERSA